MTWEKERRLHCDKLKSGILLAYAILAMSAPAVLAAQPADADNQTAGAALVNMDSRNDKEASKDCSGSDKTSSETDHDTLIPVDSDMLSDACFFRKWNRIRQHS